MRTSRSVGKPLGGRTGPRNPSNPSIGQGNRHNGIRHASRLLVTRFENSVPVEWQAGCSCNIHWRGPARVDRRDARRDWLEHHARAKTPCACGAGHLDGLTHSLDGCVEEGAV